MVQTIFKYFLNLKPNRKILKKFKEALAGDLLSFQINDCSVGSCQPMNIGWNRALTEYNGSAIWLSYIPHT
jgi:hypothetical protein